MKKELEKETESAFIEGSVSVYAVMNSGSRDIVEIFLSPDAKKDDGVCVFMSDNFRCDRPVIEFTNLVCSFLFSAC